MNVVILYESFFGNTKEIALAMGRVKDFKIEVYNVSEYVWNKNPDYQRFQTL